MVDLYRDTTGESPGGKPARHTAAVTVGTSVHLLTCCIECGFSSIAAICGATPSWRRWDLFIAQNKWTAIHRISIRIQPGLTAGDGHPWRSRVGAVSPSVAVGSGGGAPMMPHVVTLAFILHNVRGRTTALGLT